MSEFEAQVSPPIITEIPFERNHAGVFVDNVPDSLRLHAGATLDNLRSRFEHQSLIGAEELDALRLITTAYIDAGINRLVPQKDEFAGFFRHKSAQALLDTSTDRQKGTNRLDIDSENGVISADVDRLDRETLKVQEAEVVWKSQGDARLLAYVSSLGHEHAHAFAKKIAQSLNPPRERSDSFFAAYLSAHPTDGYTGILISDPRIYDERFANGLASLGVKELMAGLGYDEQEQQKVLERLMPIGQVYSYGEHTHVEAAVIARDRNLSVGQAALVLAGAEKNDHLSYEGGLGYAAPLSPYEMGEVFFFGHEALETGREVTILDPSSYRRLFDAQYNGRMHDDMEKQLAQVRAAKNLGTI